MANSVTLATRVRVEILRAVARQFSTKGGEEMYVTAYTSRPVLHIKTTGAMKPQSLTFADCMSRFGKIIDQENLNDAYRKAGRGFKGQLRQHFVVLTDDYMRENPTNIESQTNQSKRKRPLEEREGPKGSEGTGKRDGRGPKASKN
jgi:hypothetical protein